MNSLKAFESELIGKWNFINNKLVADYNCQRIEYLKASDFVKIATDDTGWEVLYKDKNDGRYWELKYPQGHLQGGGPPKLSVTSFNIAKEKYQLD